MRPHRILLVDDEPDVLESLGAVLSRASAGWEIVMAGTGAEALERLDGVDLVVADHRMPGMSGVELLARVRSMAPRAVRVLLTAYGDLDIAIAALERAEVHYFLRKPLEGREIQEVVSAALAGPRAAGAS